MTGKINARQLESLMGYNARRVWLSLVGRFGERMGAYGLKPVDFSVLSLITHNPGITSRQLCDHLHILPPQPGRHHPSVARARADRQARTSPGRPRAWPARDASGREVHG